MNPEISAIPPAPRRVRWEAVMFRRWPFALAGILLGGYGSLLTWMLWLGSTSSHVAVAEQKLGAATGRAEGTVTAVRFEPSGRERVHYWFTTDTGSRQDGESLFHVEDMQAARALGDRLAVEYVTDDPVLSRAVGGHIAFILNGSRYAFAFMVIPGLLAIVVWWLGVVRTRSMLTHGDVAIAQELTVREIPWLVPTMLDVRFRFRDRQARIRAGRHVVTARSRLGRLATARDARLGVVHDRSQPNRHHLVVPEDFLPGRDTARR